MKNAVRLAVVFIFVAGGAFMFARLEAPVSAAAGMASSASSPRTLYMQNCARCHGANGKAQTALGKRLEADDLTTSDAGTAKIIRIVTNGKGKMPAFRKKMTPAQIASLAGYVSAM